MIINQSYDHVFEQSIYGFKTTYCTFIVRGTEDKWVFFVNTTNDGTNYHTDNLFSNTNGECNALANYNMRLEVREVTDRIKHYMLLNFYKSMSLREYMDKTSEG